MIIRGQKKSRSVMNSTINSLYESRDVNLNVKLTIGSGYSRGGDYEQKYIGVNIFPNKTVSAPASYPPGSQRMESIDSFGTISNGSSGEYRLLTLMIYDGDTGSFAPRLIFDFNKTLKKIFTHASVTLNGITIKYNHVPNIITDIPYWDKSVIGYSDSLFTFNASEDIPDNSSDILAKFNTELANSINKTVDLNITLSNPVDVPKLPDYDYIEFYVKSQPWSDSSFGAYSGNGCLNSNQDILLKLWGLSCDPNFISDYSKVVTNDELYVTHPKQLKISKFSIFKSDTHDKGESVMVAIVMYTDDSKESMIYTKQFADGITVNIDDGKYISNFPRYWGRAGECNHMFSINVFGVFANGWPSECQTDWRNILGYLNSRSGQMVKIRFENLKYVS